MITKKEKKKTKQEREEEIFRYFDTILNDLETTKTWASVNVYTMFILLYVYKLISFFTNESKENYDILESIYSIFEFGNFRKIKNTQDLLYKSFVVFFTSLSVFFGFKYLSIQLNMEHRYLRFKWVDNLFSHLVSQYLWFYLIPSITIFSGEVFCHDTEDISQSTCLLDFNTFIFRLVMNIIAVLMVLSAILLNSYYHRRETMNKLDYLGVNDPNFEIKFCLYLLITTMIEGIAFKRYPYYIYKIKNIFNSVYSLYIYLDVILNFSFKKFTIQNSFVMLMGWTVSFDLACTIPQHFNSDKHYFPLWFSLLAIIFYMVSKNLVNVVAFYKIKVLKKMRVRDYKRFISIFEEGFCNDLAPRKRKMYARGMIEFHFAKCKDKNCFCKKDAMYDSKKKKNFMMQKIRGHKFFYKVFMMTILKKNQKGQYGTNDWNLFFAEFVFRKFQNIFLANLHLKRAEFMNDNYIRRFKIYRLKHKIFKFVKPDVIGNERDNFIEKVTSLERDLVIVKKEMKVILVKSLKFWKSFENFNQVALMYFKKELEEIADKKYKILENWTNITDYLKHNPMYNLYYKWYLKDFLNKRTQFSEDEMNSLGDVNKNVSLKSADFVEDLDLDSIAFFNDSGIVHLSMEKDKIGTIIEANMGICNLTGYMKSEIVGENIKKLMPKNIAEKHDDVLKNFVRTGGKKYTNGEIQSYMVLKNGMVTRVNILFKLVFNLVTGHIEMVGIIREVKTRSESNNYLLVDNAGTIHAATETFFNVTGIMPELLKMFIFNIVVFAPELKFEISAKPLGKMFKGSSKRRTGTILDPSPPKDAKRGSTSSNMLKMMKMNHKMMNLKSNSSADSSDEEDIQNSIEQFSAKMKIPLNIRKYLEIFTKRFSEEKNVTDKKKSSNQYSGVKNLFGKSKNPFLKSKSKTSSVIAAEIAESMYQMARGETFNTFKIIGKVNKRNITVLGSYKVIKLSLLKLKKKKYDPLLLRIKMKKGDSKQSSRNIDFQKERSANHSKQLMKRLNKMKSNANGDDSPSQLKPIREQEPIIEEKPEDYDSNLVESPHKIQSKLKKSVTWNDHDEQNNSEERRLERDKDRNLQLIRLRDEESLKKLQNRAKTDQLALGNYVQLLFKQVENIFKKDDINIPNENLKNGIIIKNILKIFFYILITIIVSSVLIFKIQMNYFESIEDLDKSMQVLTYHNASLNSLERYYEIQLVEKNYFNLETEQLEKDRTKYKNALEESIKTMKQQNQEDIFRNSILFSDTSTDNFYSIYYANHTETDKSEYSVTMNSLLSMYFEKINTFSQHNSKKFDFFIQENYFRYLNLFMLEKGEDIYNNKVENNNMHYEINKWTYIISIVIFLTSYFFIFRLSRIIKPCLSALIVGFNFINEETLEKIIAYFKIQLRFLNELKMQERCFSETTDGRTASRMMTMSRSNQSRFKQSNFGNKNRRVKEDGGKGARNFKLSLVFVLLIFLSLLISTTIFVFDYLFYRSTDDFIKIEKAVRAEILSMKSSSVTLLAYNLNQENYEDVKQYLVYQSDLFQNATIYNIAFANIDNMYDRVFHSNTCDLLHSLKRISDDDKEECSLAYREILFNGIKTLREETKTLVEEILGLKTNLKNLTKPEFYEYLKAIQYSEQVLFELKNELDLEGRNLIFTILIYNIVLHSLSFLLNCYISFSLEKYIGRSIGTDYVSIKKIYNHFIPNETLNKEKRLRAYFKKAGVLDN